MKYGWVVGPALFAQMLSEGRHVVTDPSGLVCAWRAHGHGKRVGENAIVELSYRAWLMGGASLDGTGARPVKMVTSVPSRSLILGFSKALTLLRQGDFALVRVPSELGYGSRGVPEEVPPNSDLIFQIKVLSVLNLDDDPLLVLSPLCAVGVIDGTLGVCCGSSLFISNQVAQRALGRLARAGALRVSALLPAGINTEHRATFLEELFRRKIVEMHS
jgi:hypothetical protein